MSIERTWSITPRGVGGVDYSRAVELYTEEPLLLFFDDFEAIRSYDTQGTAGFSVDRITTRSWRGAGCLRLSSGPLIPSFAQVNFNFGIVRSQKVLVTLAASFPTQVAGELLILALERFTGTERRNFGIRYLVSTGTWQYFDENDVWQDITGGTQSLNLDPDIWHRVQFAVDFDEFEYLYAQCNENFMDLSGIPGEGDPIGTGAYVVLRVHGGVFAANQNFYLDNVRMSELI